MRLKIQCDEECEKFCKIFWEVNKAQVVGEIQIDISFALGLSSATSGLARGFLYGRLASLEHERRGGGDHRWSSWGRRRACPCPRLVCRCVLSCCSCCMITACQCRGRWMVDAACQVFISLYSSAVMSQTFTSLTKYIKKRYIYDAS